MNEALLAVSNLPAALPGHGLDPPVLRQARVRTLYRLLEAVETFRRTHNWIDGLMVPRAGAQVDLAEGTFQQRLRDALEVEDYLDHLPASPLVPEALLEAFRYAAAPPTMLAPPSDGGNHLHRVVGDALAPSLLFVGLHLGPLLNASRALHEMVQQPAHGPAMLRLRFEAAVRAERRRVMMHNRRYAVGQEAFKFPVPIGPPTAFDVWGPGTTVSSSGWDFSAVRGSGSTGERDAAIPEDVMWRLHHMFTRLPEYATTWIRGPREFYLPPGLSPLWPHGVEGAVRFHRGVAIYYDDILAHHDGDTATGVARLALRHRALALAFEQGDRVFPPWRPSPWAQPAGRWDMPDTRVIEGVSRY